MATTHNAELTEALSIRVGYPLHRRCRRVGQLDPQSLVAQSVGMLIRSPFFIADSSAAESLLIEVSLLDDNLQPFLTAFGWLVGATLDADDFTAISWGLRDTDREDGAWFEYEFGDEARTQFAVAFDEAGGSVIWVRAEVPAEIATRIELLAQFCWEFRWHGPQA